MEIVFESDQIKWIDFMAPSVEAMKNIESEFRINTLVLQDSTEIGHLPKYEKLDNWEFLLVRFYSKSDSFYQNIVREFSNKIAIFFNDKTIITIHQHEIPFLDNIKLELSKMLKENVHFKKILYLLLSHNFFTYEKPYRAMSQELEVLENQLFLKKNVRFDQKNIYLLKREANSCKKILGITRDVLDEYLAYHKKQAYIQDVYEQNLKQLHLFNQIVEDTQNLLNVYISISSQRSNEIMKLLTIFSAFFLPLTFIVGVYGMNFRIMPELTWRYGYTGVWVIMIVIVIVIYIWFKRKRIL